MVNRTFWRESKTAAGSCTNMNDEGKFCEAATAPDSPVSLCKRHILLAYGYGQDLIAQASPELVQVVKPRDSGLNLGQPLRERMRNDMSVVYYAAIDGYIKIGTTIYLGQRMKTLGANLMATEPGGYDIEQQRHAQFADLLARGREYFRPGKALLAHVVALQ